MTDFEGTLDLVDSIQVSVRGLGVLIAERMRLEIQVNDLQKSSTEQLLEIRALKAQLEIVKSVG